MKKNLYLNVYIFVKCDNLNNYIQLIYTYFTLFSINANKKNKDLKIHIMME